MFERLFAVSILPVKLTIIYTNIYRIYSFNRLI